jgi:hypothetical protein
MIRAVSKLSIIDVSKHKIILFAKRGLDSQTLAIFETNSLSHVRDGPIKNHVGYQLYPWRMVTYIKRKNAVTKVYSRDLPQIKYNDNNTNVISE